MTEYNLYFMHPLYGTTFNVTVDAALTVSEMLRNLRLSGFLPMKGAYKMARYERELSPRLAFSQIDQLADGDVLRLMVHEGEEQEDAGQKVLLNLKVPFLSEIIQLPAPIGLTAGQFVQLLCEKGILYTFESEFQLYKGNTLLDMAAPLSNYALHDYDLLRVVTADGSDAPVVPVVSSAPLSAEMPAQLGEQLQKLQQIAERQQKALQALAEQTEATQKQIAQLGELVKNSSPSPANAAPADAGLLYQPSLELPFEPLESLVEKILSH